MIFVQGKNYLAQKITTCNISIMVWCLGVTHAVTTTLHHNYIMFKENQFTNPVYNIHWKIL